jgi:hypothetical protein
MVAGLARTDLIAGLPVPIHSRYSTRDTDAYFERTSTKGLRGKAADSSREIRRHGTRGIGDRGSKVAIFGRHIAQGALRFDMSVHTSGKGHADLI